MNFKLIGLGALVAVGVSAQADTYVYTNWQQQNTGSVNGVLNLNGGPVSVLYTGDIAFTQLNNSGYNYFQPATTFEGGAVSNAPNVSDMIALSAANTTETITFGQALLNPIIDIESLGNGGNAVTYSFNTSVTLLNSGQSSFGGNVNTLVQNGNKIIGTEGNGVVQINGLVTSFGWTVDNSEYWHGVTVGANVNPVPEPMSLGGLGLGVAALLRRRFNRN